jgi:hypothetical protein
MRDQSRADILVWELVSVRCALAQPVSDATRRALRAEEKALVGALLDLGVLSEGAVAPPPVPAPSASQPMF